ARLPRHRTPVVSHRSRLRLLRDRAAHLGGRRLSEMVLPAALGPGLCFRVWCGGAGGYGAQGRGILLLPWGQSELRPRRASRLARPWILSVSGPDEPVLP